MTALPITPFLAAVPIFREAVLEICLKFLNENSGKPIVSIRVSIPESTTTAQETKAGKAQFQGSEKELVVTLRENDG